ncbi:hypothetical protein LIER_17256 [Lithospermum erythrorhizon]|uniref:Uncharacterized protein n=1 Tax=Lithospermum erythrorhizon TaxID=34254 RepID=A0AAV3Q9V5_LITER
MLRIFCKSFHSYVTTLDPHKLFIQAFSYSPTISKKPISPIANQDSFTIRYLMNEFGFSQEKAVLASKNLHLKNRDKPDAVVAFFKKQGFTDTQIRKLISAGNHILLCKPEKTLQPKIDFFRSRGVSLTVLAKMIVYNPHLLTRSLKHSILPSFNSLRDVFGSDERVIVMLKHDSMLLTQFEYLVKPNIEILRGAGVPDSSIGFIWKHRPSLFVQARDKLVESIKDIEKMGMNLWSTSAILALTILTSMSRSRWDKKMEAYKRWGCSEDEVLTTFKRLPWIMNLSEEKIDGVMGFCVHEMGWEPSEVVVRRYFVLNMSLNKRLMPRWSVYQELVSKGLAKGKGKWRTMFTVTEDLFLEKYVNCYKNEAPLLLKRYLEKLK